MPVQEPAARAAQISPTNRVVLRRCGGVPCPPGACDHDEDGNTLGRQALDRGPQVAPPIVDGVLNAPGQPLDPELRESMGGRFGFDFSTVRIHTDRQAALSAQQVAARAYTVGRDIVFGAGEYRPDASDGRRLLAHELVHVMQQRGADNEVPLTIGSAESEHERAADQIAAAEIDRPSVQTDIRTPATTISAGADPRYFAMHHTYSSGNATVMGTLQRQPQNSPPVTEPQNPIIETTSPSWGPKTDQCGHALWRVSFKLPKATASKGWIIQEVQLIHSKDGVLDHYWEAWPIPEKQRTTGEASDDEYLWTGEAGSGFFRMVGRARFTPGPLPPPFPPDPPPRPQPTVKKKPRGWTGEGTLHTLRLDFDCTRSPGRTHLFAYDGKRVHTDEFPKRANAPGAPTPSPNPVTSPPP